MTHQRFVFGCLLAGMLFFSCNAPLPVPDAPYELKVPEGFPVPDIPADNALTQSRISLGKMLFYEPALSLDSSLSCASCHLAVAGFADHNKVSVGIEGRLGFRNSPTLTNVAYHPYFFKEGGGPTLEQQVLGPIDNHDEMGFNSAEVAKRLAGDSKYMRLAGEAYDRDMDLFVLTRAIAAFERTMISGNSPYDQFRRGDEYALDESEKAGMELFFSERTSCSSCHTGFDFSDYRFANNGLHESLIDLGRYRITLDSADIGKFKLPTLRNIGLTAPYMHDGSMPDLESVIEHYAAGGSGHFNQDPLIRPLNLTEEEKTNLIAFLHSLTDIEFITNPEFLP